MNWNCFGSTRNSSRDARQPSQGNRATAEFQQHTDNPEPVTNSPTMNRSAQNERTFAADSRPFSRRVDSMAIPFKKEDYIEYDAIRLRNATAAKELEDIKKQFEEFKNESDQNKYAAEKEINLLRAENSKNKREYNKQKCEQEIKHKQELNTLREKLGMTTVQSEEAQKLREDIHQLTEEHNMQEEKNKLKDQEIEKLSDETNKLSGTVKELEDEILQLKTRSPLKIIPHMQNIERESNVQNSQIPISSRISKPKTMSLLEANDKIDYEQNPFKLRETIGKLSVELKAAKQEIIKQSNEYKALQTIKQSNKGNQTLEMTTENKQLHREVEKLKQVIFNNQTETEDMKTQYEVEINELKHKLSELSGYVDPDMVQEYADDENMLPTMTPEEQYEKESLEKIEEIKENSKEFEMQIVTFEGAKKDRTYVHIEEMLIRNLVKLDNVESEGNATIRQERKIALQYVQKCLDDLKAKVTEDGTVLEK